MGQKDGEKWTAAVDSQPTLPKSDRLLGYLETTRGRGGGLRLMAPAATTRVGEIVRHTETNFTLLACFDPVDNSCQLAGHCRLQTTLQEALARFLEVLDGITLADLMPPGVRCFPLAALGMAPTHAQPRALRKV